MTDRFSKAKTRLLSHEQQIQKERTLKKRMGKILPDETIKIPKIGEWNLSEINPINTISGTHSKTSKRVQGFPNVPLSPDQKTRMSHPVQDLIPPSPPRTKTIRPVYKIKSPRTTATENPRTNFPTGTVTTDLDSILKSTFRQTTKELPPMEKLETEESTSTFMPLEYFDDSTFEQYPIEKLLENPSAYSQYQEINGNHYWAKCTVLSYDPETKLFVIEWDSTKKRKKVSRFNLRFAIEDETLFQKRIESAKKSCKEYESQIRFDNRIQQMSIENLPELSKDDITDIINLMNININEEDQKTIDSLMEEIQYNFKRMNNQLQFEYELKLNPLIPDRESFLEIIKKPEKIPNSGLIEHEPDDFNALLKKISSELLMANVNILNGIMIIWNIFQGVENVTFLTPGFNNEILNLETFMLKQYRKLEESKNDFKISIQDNVDSIITKVINEEYDFNHNKEKIKITKMKYLATRMLHNVLLLLITNTVTQFNSFFEKFLENNNMLNPQFSIKLIFNDNKLQFSPTLNSFHDQIIGLFLQLETSTNQLSTIGSTIIEIEPLNISFDDCKDIIDDHKNILSEIFQKLFKDLNDFINKYQYIEPTMLLNPENFAQEFDPEGKRNLEDYRTQLNEFCKLLDIAQHEILLKYKINIFELDCNTFQQSLINQCKSLIFCLLTRLKTFGINGLKELQNEFENIQNKFKVIPQTPEELVTLKEFMNNVLETMNERSIKLNQIIERLTFLEEYKFEITDEECEQKYKTLQMPYKLSLMIDETDRMLQVERIKMIRDLRTDQRKLETDTLDVSQLIPTFVSKYQDLEMTIDAIDQAQQIYQRLLELKKQQERINSHEKIFNYEQFSCRILTKIIQDFSGIFSLWKLASDWLNNNTQWLDQPFPQIKPDIINNFLIQANKQILKLKKDLVQHPNLIEKVLKPLSEQINEFKLKIPLISKLRHPGIKTQHWEIISKIVGFKIQPSLDFTLKDFLNLNLDQWSQQIFEVTTIATQEYNIESSLDQMDIELQSCKFQTIEYKTDTNKFILIEIDEILSLIDDQITSIQNLLTSPYVKHVKNRSLEKLEFLRKCHLIIEVWIEVQKNWLYLQPIFDGTTIQQKLYKESRDWNTIDKIWTVIMNSTHIHPSF